MRPLLALLLLAGCASGAPPAAPPDPLLDQLLRAGVRALEAEQAEQAGRIYEQALARARLRDEPGPLADSAFGLATARLAAGDPAGARDAASGMREELAWRGISPPPALTLAEATARFRLGEAAAAAALLGDVEARAAEDPDAARRGAFLRGLLAERAGDRAALEVARAAIGAPADPGFAADARELAARSALLAGDAAAAFAEAGAAAALRREALDYRGVARALALQGEAASREGRARVAADLFLRAGRSAAARGEPEAAAWLARSERLAEQAGEPALRRSAAAQRRTRSSR